MTGPLLSLFLFVFFYLSFSVKHVRAAGGTPAIVAGPAAAPLAGRPACPFLYASYLAPFYRVETRGAAGDVLCVRARVRAECVWPPPGRHGCVVAARSRRSRVQGRASLALGRRRERPATPAGAPAEPSTGYERKEA